MPGEKYVMTAAARWASGGERGRGARLVVVLEKAREPVLVLGLRAEV
jgi:hypothetical protein